MKNTLTLLLRWSPVISLPVVILGSYLLFHTVEQYYSFAIRYEPKPSTLTLTQAGQYQYSALLQRIRSAFHAAEETTTGLQSIRLYLPEDELSKLNEHLPQSGFKYVKGRILNAGSLQGVKIKYRGDFLYHWGYDKKSLRVKTGKNTLYSGLRRFNLQAAKSSEQLNNYLSYRLAKMMGLLVPHTELVRTYINDKYRGVHILVEQPEEMLLRRYKVMPGDIYRGETVGKDRFVDSGLDSLFQSTAIWDKMAENNHYDEDHKAPLAQLLAFVEERHSSEVQARLGELLDLEAWGRFSAFESLTQTRHYTTNHNWRLYYDPWKQKIIPLVWDPVGWAKGFRPLPGTDPQNHIIVSSLHHLLFMNGDFIRHRSKALQDFYTSDKDDKFLSLAENTLLLMEQEVYADPGLNPPAPDLVKKKMRILVEDIRQILSSLERSYVKDASSMNYVIHPEKLELEVFGHRPISKLQLILDKKIDSLPKLSAQYKTSKDDTIVIDLYKGTSISGNHINVKTGFVSNMKVYAKSSDKYPRRDIEVKPGYYILTLQDEITDHLIGVRIDMGNGWETASKVTAVQPAEFDTLHSVLSEQSSQTPMIWTGEITVTGVQTIAQPLIIRPGTIVKMDAGATLVLKNRLHMEGTEQHPIRIIPLSAEQQPWGAIVLIGKDANASTLSHCEFSHGSGLKSALFEYSGMLSIHDVDNVTVSHCLFQDSQLVDDMVHAVYADIEFRHCTFRNSFADALDLDLSRALIDNSLFENSGNDAVDMMGARVTITDSLFKHSGDKGISVGEGSHLLAVNNRLTGNLIGIQAKDQSLALLFNQTLKNNQQALHAYKKNWSYGTGGEIYMAKSRLLNNRKPITADEHSTMLLFDSFVDHHFNNNRIKAIEVDDKKPSLAAAHGEFIPQAASRHADMSQALEKYGADSLKKASITRRGAH